MYFDIILSLIIVIQFIYLFTRTNKMALIDDLRTAALDLSASADQLIAIAEQLKIDLSNSIPASEIQPIIDQLKSTKTKIDTAANG